MLHEFRSSEYGPFYATHRLDGRPLSGRGPGWCNDEYRPGVVPAPFLDMPGGYIRLEADGKTTICSGGVYVTGTADEVADWFIASWPMFDGSRAVAERIRSLGQGHDRMVAAGEAKGGLRRPMAQS